MPKALHAQQFTGNPDRFASEVASWMLQSKYQDAPQIAAKWSTFWQSTPQENLRTQITQTATKGMRSPQIAYLFVRVYLQSSSELQSELLQIWPKILEAKDPKIAIALLEQIDSWQYNQTLSGTGNYQIRIQGNLHLAWHQTQAVVSEADSWDSESPLSDATPTFTFSNGPTLTWNKAVLQSKISRDSLEIAPDSFQWSIKDRLGIGTLARLKGGAYGDWEIKTFQLIPRKGVLVSQEGTLKLGERLLEGSGKLSLKRKAGTPFFSFDFQSKTELKEPLQGLYWKAFGRLNIQDNKQGISAYGSSPARIEVYTQKQKLAEFKTPLAYISADEKIQMPQGEFTAFVGPKDSLYHANVRANWVPGEEAWHINLNESKQMFEESFHQMRIAGDLAILKVAARMIDFYRVSGRAQVPAWVESFDFFDAERIDSEQGILTYDPLRVLYNYLNETKQNEAYLGDIATRYQRDPKTLQGGFEQFKRAGLLNYQASTDRVSWTRLGKHYAQVKFAKKDFDRFYVPSYGNLVPRDSANISLDLAQKKLMVRGIKEVMVSDSLKANFLPSDSQISFSQGRDFDFKGEIKIGNYRFRGPAFYFNFTNFAVQFPKIDSITFLPKNSSHEVGGQFKYEAGTILLSPPSNKSGRNGIAAYPKLLIPNGVVSYFDEDWRAQGVYTKKHYFKVPRIELDSLTQKEITFQGNFYSEGLLPPLKASLVLMPDQSFGFQYTSKSPLEIYKGQAKYTLSAPLTMNRTGLQSQGSLQYLGLLAQEKATHFYPDSLISSGTEAKITSVFGGKSIFPEAKIPAHSLRWIPSQDSLWIQPEKTSISLFQNQVQVEGRLGMHQKQVFAQGKMTFSDGVFVGNNFRLNANSWHGDQVEMKIGRQMALFKPAVQAQSVTIDATVGTGKMTIKPMKGEESPIVFPFIAYQSTLKDAVWDTQNQTFKMTGKSGFELQRWAENDSLIPDQSQGLIRANTAEYDLKGQILSLGGVKEVGSGPSQIYPAKGLFGLQKDGAFKPFTGARALLNGTHMLADLKVTEGNSTSWKGEANYLYPRSDGDTVKVTLRNFAFVESVLANKKTETVITAEGLISEKTPMNFSKHQQFKGEVALNSGKANLQFKGFLRPVLGLPNFKAAWIPFENAKGETPTLKLDPSVRDEAGRPVTAGIFINADNKLYPTFLGPVSDDLDPVLFQAEGEVVEEKDRYEVKGKDSEIRLFVEKRRMEAEGAVQLFTGNKPIKAFGKIDMSTDSLVPRLETWLSLQFVFPPNLLKVMGDRIVKFGLDEGIPGESADEPENRDAYLKRAAQVLGRPIPEAIRTKMDQVHLGLDKVAPEFAGSINLSAVRWVWSPNTSSFYSVGGLPVVNVGPVDVNSTLKGYMEVIKKPSKEEFYGYWELSEDLWYYFAYFNGELGVYSSDNAFLAAIREAVKGDKKGKLAVVEAAADEKDAFLKRFLSYYRGVSPAKKAAPVKKSAPAKPAVKKGGF
jgi:hypothetical protein